MAGPSPVKQSKHEKYQTCECFHQTIVTIWKPKSDFQKVSKKHLRNIFDTLYVWFLFSSYHVSNEKLPKKVIEI